MRRQTMGNVGEAARLELLTLKEVRETGRARNHEIARQLLNTGMIAGFQNGKLELSEEGRRMLMRGFAYTLDTAS